MLLRPPSREVHLPPPRPREMGSPYKGLVRDIPDTLSARDVQSVSQVFHVSSPKLTCR